MPGEKAPKPEQPTIGRIVIYRTKAGADIPAIVTAVIDLEGAVHLQQFVPPGVGMDAISYEWGVDGPAERNGCWRWPERA